jgi:ketosteroid isomerase-like protein
MSQENVELVRSGIDAYNRRDWDALLEHAGPDFVWDMSRSIGPNRGMYSVDQFRSWVEDLWATFEEHRFEADEFIEAGENVVVPITVHATGRDGIEAQAHTALAYTFRDGAVTRIAMYNELQEALEAAGLRE